MKVGKTTVRFPEEEEYHGRAPRIIVSAEGRLGDALNATPYVLTIIAVALLSWALYKSAAPPWAYSIILPVIGLGVMKTLEARRMAAVAVARVVVRRDTLN